MNGGEFLELKEKPEYVFLVKSGVYIVNPGISKFISKDERCDIPQIISRLRKKGKRIGVYPSSDKSRIGMW